MDEVLMENKKVLILDDEPQVLAALEDLLEDDFEVLAMSSARDALKYLKDEEVSVILSDQRMPGMSGDEFLARAQQYSDASRLMITGYADLEALVRAVNEGKIFGYVAKPWNPEILLTLVFKASEYCKLVRELQYERTLLHALMDNIPDLVYFKDRQSRFLRVNLAHARASGLENPEDVMGKSGFDSWRAEEAEKSLAAERYIMESGEPLADLVEKVYIQGKGATWFSSTKAPIKDRGGRITGLVGITRDISERKREELREQVTHRMREEVWRMEGVDDMRHLLYTLREGMEVLGVPFEGCELNLIEREEEEIRILLYNLDIGGALGEETSEEGESSVVELWREGKTVYHRDLEGEDAHGVRVRHNRNFGMEIRSVLDVPFRCGILTINSSLPNAFSSQDIALIESLAGVLSDGCKRVEDLKVLRETEAQLRQSQKMEAIGKLAGGVAHDFNNLLTIISSYCQFLRRSLEEGDERRMQVEEIYAAGERAVGLVRQLLAFSRRRPLEPEPIDVNRIVVEMEKMLRRLIGEDIELEMALTGDLGRVLADPGQLEQVLMNLVVNARDAMSEGGRLVIETEKIHFADAVAHRGVQIQPGAYIMLAVSDTGTGIDEETQRHIFEPFFTTKAEGQGTGLGLSTVYGIVRQSGGHIWVYSEVGQGTTFKIYLPQVESGVRTRQPQVALEEGSLKGSETVLVVEDEVSLMGIVRLVLSECGYTVLEAQHPDKALEVLEQHQGEVHLLFTDLVLPGMNGRQLAERVRAQQPGIRVLYTSGFIDHAALSQGGEIEPQHFLQKPFSPNGLVRRIRQVLDEEGEKQPEN